MAFSDADVATAVSQAFAVAEAIPPDHRGGFVTLADQDGVKAVIAEKVGGVWAVTAYVDHPWSGALQYGATIQATW